MGRVKSCREGEEEEEIDRFEGGFSWQLDKAPSLNTQKGNEVMKKRKGKGREGKKTVNS